MKRSIVIAAVITLFLSINSYAFVAAQWKVLPGTDATDTYYEMCADDNGIYITGSTYGSFPGNTNEGIYDDAFLLKYDRYGSLVWARQFYFGGDWNDRGNSVATDSSGNIFVSGSLFQYQYRFMRKYDTNGNMLWQTLTATGNCPTIEATAVNNSSGVVYITYNVYNTHDYDVVVDKYDANTGNFISSLTAGTTGYDYVKDLKIDSSGNVYLLGYTDSSFTGQQALGNGDAFVRKYDIDGNILWTLQCGTTHYEDIPYSIVIDSVTNALISCNSGNSADAYIIKIASSGTNVLWNRGYGSSREGGKMWRDDAVGALYIAALSKLDSEAVQDWDTRVNGSSDNDYDIDLAWGGMYLAGQYWGTDKNVELYQYAWPDLTKINNFSGYETGLQKVSLQWTSPSSATIRKYEIKYTENASNDYWSSPYTLTWSTSTSNGVVETKLITGLTGGSTYYFRIRATDNSTGWNECSAQYGGICIPRDTTPPTGTPGTPVDTGMYSTSTLITFEWSIGTIEDTDTAISDYYLQVATAATDCESYIYGTSEGLNTSDVIGNIVTGTTYYARVKAANIDGYYSNWSSWSNGILIDTITPSAVGTVRDGTGVDIVFTNNFDRLSGNWDEATDEGSGIAGYYCAIGTTSGGTDILAWTSTGTSRDFTKTGLTLVYNTTYYFSVKCIDNVGFYSGVTTSNGQVVIDVSAPVGVPSAPADTGTISTTTALSFVWGFGLCIDPESGVSGYHLQVSTADSECEEHLFDSYVGNTESYTVTGGVTGITYYARVKGRNGQYLYSNYSVWNDGILVDTVTPSAVSIVKDSTGTDIAVTNNFDTLSANWSAATDEGSGIAGYYYAMGTNSGGTNIVDWTSVGTSVNVTKTGLSLMYNTTYYVSVKAVDNAGLYSNVTTSNGQVVIDSSTPQGLASTPIDAGAYSTMTALTFTWSAGTLVDIESGISGYYLQVSTAATEASAFLYDAYIGNVLTQEVTGAVTGKTYYVRIKARNGQSLYGSYTTWSDGILVDTTPPVFSYIYDGTDTDSEYNMSSTTLAANWKFIDTETSITTNYYCIGTTSGGTDIIGWTSVETDTYTVKTGLTLVQDTTYYFSVKARNAAGLSTEVYSSTGIVLPKPTGSATRVYPSKFTSSQTSYDITWTAGTLTDITGINGYWLQVATAPYDCISYLIDNYIGNYTTWTITGCQDKKTYYARIKGKNNVSVYGQWNAWSEGTSIDLTAPSAPAAVRDGLGSGTSITSSSHTLSANWDIAIDNDSGISRYRYAIGSTPGGADLKNWTEATLWANITQTTRPSARYVYGMAADAVSNKIVVYGGWNGGVLSDTWEYDINLNIWVNKNPSSVPSGQRGVKLVYDTENKKFVTFGGYNGTAQLQDTYVYDDVQNSWTNMNPSTKPSIREYYSMVYDSYNEKTLLFGGWEGVNRYNDTWAYDYAVNTWTGLNPGGSLPPVRYGQSMVYDSNNRQVILFGGSGDSGYLDDTWIYNYGNNTWTQKFPINKPSARYEHSMVYDPVNKRVLLFGGYGSSGYLKDTWYYDVSGNQWYELNPSSSPQQRYGAGMVYDRTTKTSFLLGGYQLGYLDDVQVFKPGTSVSQSGLSLIENSTYYYSVYYENGAGAYGTIASDGQYYNSAYVPPVTPVISSMTTTSGYEDDIITIYGTSFLALQGTSYVKFYNNQVSSITLWSDTIITCKVPPSAETGSVTVNTSGGESNGINFTILYSTYGVSGYVKDNSSNVLVGIQVTLSGDSSGSTYTDATGYFFVYVSTNSYTITPSSTNWSFSPSSRNYSTLISSQTGQNFYGTYTGPVYYKVCGYVLDNSSSALTGMTVSLSGEISGTTLTDGNGYYELTVTTNSFVVTVSSNNWRFLPVNRSYSLLSSTQTSQNVFGTYNYAPILEWAGEAGYTDDGLNYDSGTSTTAFVYRVKYTDQDNDAPVNGYPKLYIKRNGVNISGSPFVLTYVSGNNNTGAVYSSTNSLLPSSGYTYYFAAYDIWGATATGTPLTPVARPVVTNIIPELSWSGETGYTTDGINYETGVSSTLYTYRIKFMDLDNESPAAGYPKLYIKKNGVNISGSPFTMAYFSGNYNTGAIYFYHASLTPGNDYTYYFEAYDLSYATATGMPAASKDAPDVINNSPSISWTSEAGYTSDGLNPEDGATSTQFVYRVKYTDPDNDAPATGYPKLYLKTNGVNIPGSPFTMTMITGNYTLGVTFTYTTTLSTGTNYTYCFEAYDIWNTTATGSPAGILSGPVVSNNAPSISWTGETGYTWDGLNTEVGTATGTYIYRIRYTDIDNDAPSIGYPKVHILKHGTELSGSPYTMASVDPVQYSGGKVYSFTLTTGLLSKSTAYTYYFEAYDIQGATAVYVQPGVIDAPDIVNIAPVLAWTGEAGFESDGLNNETGTSSTTFVYHVLYTDTDNDSPKNGYPKVYIKKDGIALNGSPYAMTYSTGDYSTGAVYLFNIAALAGCTNYIYYFEAYDVESATATGLNGNIISAPDVNNAPVLSFTGGAQYLNDGLNFDSGVSTTVFIYRIKYADIDGNQPAEGYPKVHVLKPNSNNIDTVFTMTAVDSNTYTSGRIYEFSTTFTPGTVYTYYFEACDILSSSSTAVVVTQLLPGPTVYIEYIVSSSTNVSVNEQKTVRISPETGEMKVMINERTFAENVTVNISTIIVSVVREQQMKPTTIGLEIKTDKQIQPVKEVTIALSYRDGDILGMDENKFIVCRYDEVNMLWIPLPTRRYADNNYIEGLTDHLSKFAIMQFMPGANVQGVKVYPNPFNPLKHIQGMTIMNLTENANVGIYSISGELVRKIEERDGDGLCIWDGKNDTGEYVSTSIYVIVVKGPGDVKKAKIAVIR